jgi:hypothetical protein
MKAVNNLEDSKVEQGSKDTETIYDTDGSNWVRWKNIPEKSSGTFILYPGNWIQR